MKRIVVSKFDGKSKGFHDSSQVKKVLNKGHIYQLIEILLRGIRFTADILKMARLTAVSV